MLVAWAISMHRRTQIAMGRLVRTRPKRLILLRVVLNWWQAGMGSRMMHRLHAFRLFLLLLPLLLPLLLCLELM